MLVQPSFSIRAQSPASDTTMAAALSAPANALVRRRIAQDSRFQELVASAAFGQIAHRAVERPALP
jgi:hypothetical protein